MNKICSYIVKYDVGLAPNPFWGYCTLAVCTPNHQGAKLLKDDWIIGISPKEDGNRLVYLMQLTEQPMHFNQYYSDKRFQNKKPNKRGNYKEIVGDNFYFLGENKIWKQHSTLLHNDIESFNQDTEYPYVFISKNFSYLGNKRIPLNKDYEKFIYARQGIKYFYDIELIGQLSEEIKNNYGTGLIGRPLNQIKTTSC